MSYPKSFRTLTTLLLALLALGSMPAGETRNPIPITLEAPKYPYDMRRQKISGDVVVEFIIGPEGKVVAAQVLESSHPGLNHNALAAVRNWRFKPGLKDGQAVNVRASQRITFEMPKRRQMLPFGEEKKKGTASVAFWLDEGGRLVRTEVIKASSPAFGKAAAAVVAAEWTHDPKIRDGKPGRYESHFGFGSSKGELGKHAAAVLKKLQDQKATFPGEGELDGPLKVLFQEEAVFPPALRDTHAAGSARVEFVVDPEGLVQWPRVIEATHEDFGYAAVQAVGQWEFEPPKRQGQPVAVRVTRTVEFLSPAAGAQR